jgi:MoxR-like ATPase
VALQRATQALAFLLGRDYAIPDDVKFLVPHVLCHRLIPRGGRGARTIVERLLRSLPIP